MPGLVQSVERAAAMLQLLASQMEPLGLSQISTALGLAKGTAHGLLRTLVEVGFVVQVPETGHYEVSPDLYRLGSMPPDVNELRARALNWTDVLAARTGEAASVAVFRDGRGASIHSVFGAHDDEMAGRSSSVIWLHATALGKVLLAFDPGAGRALRAADQDWPALTFRSITGRTELFRELAVIRDQGWSGEIDESVIGHAGVAAPVRDRGGFVVAAVGIQGPTDRICDDARRIRPGLVGEVQRAARSISRELGHGHAE